MKAMAELAELARATLRQNNKNGYTIPAQGLYPFQWNWDSGICALGWSQFDEPRAWEEFHFLIKGQWENGMIPHIVFHGPSDQYFPGPDQWGLEDRTPPTTSISQPPLLATVVNLMVEESRDQDLAREQARSLLPSLIAYHRWWYRDRDPEQSGLVVSYHPWESGMDNSPAWDEALARVPAVDREYHRRDLEHVDSDQRPLQSEYDRYLYLVDFFKSCRYDGRLIYERCPYRIQDIGIISILHRATLDLLDLCQKLDYPEDVSDLSEALGRTRRALPLMWSEDRQSFVNRDHVKGELIPVITTGCLLPLYGRLLEPAALAQTVSLTEGWLARQPCGLSSTHPDEPSFDAKRYWRGPTWLHINWMIAKGLREYRLNDTAEKLKSASRNLVETSGYWEYYHPVTGEGYGGPNFSWTAAMALYWLME